MSENNHNNHIDKIVPVNLEDEMRKSYIDYAMSVIVARALPDVRDGLKPVHRRILFSMNELNLDPTKGYKKSARIVGDTMGKYHPHGDSSIYDAMVRMAQDFSTRYLLVDGHGNFGSMDGDGAAAQRYTEARLSRMAVEMLQDIEKDTVDFVPNYDEELKEPTVLPARFPNLLVNGSSGIAVGMATNIPPHNLTEVIDGIFKIMDNHTIEGRETDVSELLDIIKGPDFPTGATILGTSGIKEAYRTGRGKIRVRAVANIEPMKNGREMIVVTELPYQVNKARLVEKIGLLVSEKKIEGISDIRDESDRTGVRVVFELKKDANSNVILNQLYKYSQMQESFGVIMLALVDNKPCTLNIKEILTHYIEHQKSVVTRRTRFELKKAEKRAHILEGYIIALDNIDEVLNIIRNSKDTQTAKVNLSERFGLSDEQTGAIVEMRFRSLTGLERDKIENEYAEIKELIKELMAILADEKRLYAVIREELAIIREKYGDSRRTIIQHDPGEIDYEDLIDEEVSVVTQTVMGYIKRLPLSTYRSQNRGGRGVMGMQTREEDTVKNVFIASTHDYILFFTSFGRAFCIKAYEIPEAGRVAKGLAIVNLLNLAAGEKIAAVMPVSEFTDNEYIMMVTKKGLAKKTYMSQFGKIRKGGLLALNFREDDELITVLRTDGTSRIFIATKNGIGLKFDESEVRPMGRTAAGVRAIRLREDDIVVSADTIAAGVEDTQLLFVSEGGFGKRTDIGQFSLQHRGGMGVRIYKITDKTGCVVGVLKVDDDDELMLINSDGVIIRIRVADISVKGRVTQGVKLINLTEGGTVISMAKIDKNQLDDEEEIQEIQELQEIQEVEFEDEVIEDEVVEDEADDSEE